MRFLFIIYSFFAFMQPAYAQALNPKPFGLWLGEFKQEALEQGISQATLDEAFADAGPILRIVELDRKQPESRLTLAQYMKNVVTRQRIEKGRALLAEHRELLDEISAKYQVQPRFIVALWGVETSFGANTGGFNIFHALATLAYEGRRSDFFRGELIKALQIAESDHMAASDMKSSWAGAMGQCQFMPSSFLNFAQDYDQDGKRDIWNTTSDVFASIANYLHSSGWNGNEGWGTPVLLPEQFNLALADFSLIKPIAAWAALGVRKSDGSRLPDSDIMASIILVGEGEDAKPYMVYGNYSVLLKWNRSRYFATAVSTLADAIGGGE